MALSNASALGVCLLLMLFVVAMIGIDEVVEFADLALEMVEAFLCVVQVGFWWWGRLSVKWRGSISRGSPAHLSSGCGAREKYCDPLSCPSAMLSPYHRLLLRTCWQSGFSVG